MLRAASLFTGAGGMQPVDLRAVVSIATSALALGPELPVLEINPLAIFSDRAEVMDAPLI